MRRIGFWIPAGLLALTLLLVWGVWTQRLNAANQALAMQLEAERQRSFTDMAHHVEQIQALLGKGLATGSTRQNMRYMSDVHHHAMSAVDRFTALPLPAELSAVTGKFLQQTGDFAVSLLRHEAAGGEMTAAQRDELSRLRQQSADLSANLQAVMQVYNQDGIRWAPATDLSWATLLYGPAILQKAPTGAQAPASLSPGGWNQVGVSMEQLPVMVYNGPFSDHVAQRAPAVSGPPVDQQEAEQRMRETVPGAQGYAVVDVAAVNGTLPAYSFRLTPEAVAKGGAPGPYTMVAEITRNGGHLLQTINSRAVGSATVELPQAQRKSQEYLESIGYTGMVPTYSQIDDGIATLAFAYTQDDVLIYPDQIKLKVALDNGEIMAMDARQYLMFHHTRTWDRPTISATQARANLNQHAAPERVRLALIPDLAGTGEILAWEFLTTVDGETYLVYINTATGHEEQILQLINTDGGTFAL